jgi:hypothetical protein
MPRPPAAVAGNARIGGLVRRLLISSVLAIFAGGPLLQLNCEIVCAEEDATESAAVSHHPDAVSAPSISMPDDCAAHGAAAPMLASRRSIGSDAPAGIEVVSRIPVLRASALEAVPIVRPPGGPPSSLVLPLRV